MSAEFFLDTNIFVYAFDDTSKRKQQIAERLIETALRDGSGIISYQVVQEFLNVSQSKFKVPLTPIEAQAYLSGVLRPLCRVWSSVSLFDTGIRLKERYKLSWYDALIVAAALEANCRIVHSEDLQHGMEIERTLRVQSPFAE